ncbi:hypothetical protein B0T18DRAFT_395028 [Schizothecium vesticola]|uniref:Uncharacterized protein n=1 Tax=Schizothecium vesticola TaxID=314040 RepID=A0AA40BQY9_9PEZI|nr:hypothetical protein B0T18DRAFT_395028 [Schizothecium vesticola]
MLVRDIKRLVLVVGPVLFLLFLGASLWDSELAFRLRSHAGEFLGTAKMLEADYPHRRPYEPASGHNAAPSGAAPGHGHQETHREIFSLSTADKKYFPIKFGNQEAFNPNIIPHPTKDNTCIIVGQKATGPHDPKFNFFEVGCEAVFIDGTLRCLDDDDMPAILPVAPTVGLPLSCENEPGIAGMLGLNIGPHDARLLYGPTKPYLLFGSNSMFTCFGMWLQDFRTLMDWDAADETTDGDFARATELQRPPPFSGIEKNWFIFWDRDDTPHVHIDTFPTRVMARLHPDGSVGKDLSRYAAEQDERCLAHYLPPLPPRNESIHQATNSLRVTTCRRGDCDPGETNTVIVTIIQHKKYYDYHGEYEPYVVAFRDGTPFEIVGISEKPLWIHGREYLPGGEASEMFYLVSMNWKERGRNYHGYLDDEILLAFGIEDKGSGGVDVRAGDLLAGLGRCAEV